MSWREVEKAIMRVQPYVFEFQPNPPISDIIQGAEANNHEESTRYIIIDPILRALGWDLSNPKECVVQYDIHRGKPRFQPSGARYIDYVLLDHEGKPTIAIEAKRIDTDTRSEEFLDKMEEYIEGMKTVRAAVLTNGQYWAIGLRDGQGEWMADRLKPLGLHWHDTTDTAKRLYNSLAKRNYR